MEERESVRESKKWGSEERCDLRHGSHKPDLNRGFDMSRIDERRASIVIDELRRGEEMDEPGWRRALRVAVANPRRMC